MLFPRFVTGWLINAALMASPAFGEPLPVRVTGHTTAGDELLYDTLNTLTQYAPAFDCDRISTVDTLVFEPDRVPRYASFRVAQSRATYERWTANFCGKYVKFMVIFVPDPQGGTSIIVHYPYPSDAL